MKRNMTWPGSQLEHFELYSQRDSHQQSFVSQMSSYVASELERVMPLALARGPKREPALFHRKEIIIGNRLGTGGFSHVHEIEGFDLQEDISSILKPEQRDARQKMAKCAVVNGKCQYAIKYLQPKLLDYPEEFARAVADLAIEASFLSTLDHPNIVSLQGIAIDGLESYIDGRHDSFFLITERLEDTLEDRVKRWRNNASIDVPLLRKVEMSQDLANALLYLHQRRIVFRDLKPANVGFSAIDDTIKLFDFGLSRELPSDGSYSDVYQMSGVGTRRYMAVEAVLNKPYNCKVDTYGWGMMFCEMLTLIKPFSEFTHKDHMLRVCLGGERPAMSSNLPLIIRCLLHQCWEESVPERLTMDEVCHQMAFIRQELYHDMVNRTACASSEVAKSLPNRSASLHTYDFQSELDSTDNIQEWMGGGLSKRCTIPTCTGFFVDIRFMGMKIHGLVRAG